MGPDELKSKALELYLQMNGGITMGRLFGPTGGQFFFPAGISFHPAQSNWLSQHINHYRSTGGPISDFDFWNAYAEWHETVHMMQLLTSPYISQYAFELEYLARNAYFSADRSEIVQLQEAYRKINSDWEDTKFGYSPLVLCELHAVTQGLLWSTGRNPDSLPMIIKRFYDKAGGAYASVCALMDDLISKLRLSEDKVCMLLPRLCMIAFQSDQPSFAFYILIGRLIQERVGEYMSTASPRELCDWASPGCIQVITKSLRERMQPVGMEGYFRLFSIYFDNYEERSIEERLRVLFGESGPDTSSVFRPITIYSDGEIRFPYLTEDPEEVVISTQKEYLIFINNLLKGMEILHTPAPPLKT